jgi:hypothetical protein
MLQIKRVISSDNLLSDKTSPIKQIKFGLKAIKEKENDENESLSDDEMSVQYSEFKDD